MHDPGLGHRCLFIHNLTHVELSIVLCLRSIEVDRVRCQLSVIGIQVLTLLLATFLHFERLT